MTLVPSASMSTTSFWLCLAISRRSRCNVQTGLPWLSRMGYIPKALSPPIFRAIAFTRGSLTESIICGRPVSIAKIWQSPESASEFLLVARLTFAIFDPPQLLNPTTVFLSTKCSTRLTIPRWYPHSANLSWSTLINRLSDVSLPNSEIASAITRASSVALPLSHPAEAAMQRDWREVPRWPFPHACRLTQRSFRLRLLRLPRRGLQRSGQKCGTCVREQPVSIHYVLQVLVGDARKAGSITSRCKALCVGTPFKSG